MTGKLATAAQEARTVAAARTGAGAAMICAAARPRPLPSGEQSIACSEAEIYAAIATALLRHSALDVFIHISRPASEKAVHAAIAECSRIAPEYRLRVRALSATPLDALLPSVDLLVSFDSPALIVGCRNGLKPVQIGAALVGTEDFSNAFHDVRAFAEALASHRLGASLSLVEYQSFEAFLRSLTEPSGSALRFVLGRRRQWPRDVVRAARQPATARSLVRTLANALANPTAARLLARAGWSISPLLSAPRQRAENRRAAGGRRLI